MSKSKLNNWFITFTSHKKIIYYDEYNQDVESAWLCGGGNGFGCGCGYGRVNGEGFVYTFDHLTDSLANGSGALNGDGNGSGFGNGYGYDDGSIRE